MPPTKGNSIMAKDASTSASPVLADYPATLSTGLSFANSAVSQSVQSLGLIHQARLAQQNRTVAVLTTQYGVDSVQVKTAQAAVSSSQTAISRLATVNKQVQAASPQVSADGWALYGHVYNSSLQPASAYTVFLVDEQNAYQSAVGFTYTGSDGGFVLNYSGATKLPPSVQLFLQIANNQALPVYLSSTAFQPTAGTATYQDVTLAAGEPALGDPPKEIRPIAMPDTKKK
jgi:hypothetical protein